MSNLARFNPEDYSQLVERWLQAEQKGEQFPVDFDLAWKIAGYSKKSNARRRLESKSSYLKLGRDYTITEGTVLLQSEQSALCGRSSDLILLTCDAFKHFCLMAETEQGEQVRQYFIEAEKRWRLVQEHRPQVSAEIERLQMELAIAKETRMAVEHQRVMSDNHRALFERREAIAQLHGFPILALLDNRPDAIVPKIEKVTETIVCQDGHRVSFEGKSTAQAAKELGFKTGRQLEDWLDQVGESGLICQGLRAVPAPYIPTEYLSRLNQLWAQHRHSANRQMLLGENE